jgi:hypothetical protein
MTPNLKGNAADAAQQFFSDAMDEAKAAQKKYENHAWWRYWVAIVLKGIAIFGGLAVATLDVDKVVLGIIISAAVAFDQLFSNYRRMMTETIAGAAVARTIRKVEGNYNDQVIDVIRANQQGNPTVAYDLLLTLARISARTIRSEMDRIKTAVENANIEFLSSLNLDQPAKTTLPQTPDDAAPNPPVRPVSIPLNTVPQAPENPPQT